MVIAERRQFCRNRIATITPTPHKAKPDERELPSKSTTASSRKGNVAQFAAERGAHADEEDLPSHISKKRRGVSLQRKRGESKPSMERKKRQLAHNPTLKPHEFGVV